jgi:hypothetical protein
VQPVKSAAKRTSGGAASSGKGSSASAAEGSAPNELAARGGGAGAAAAAPSAIKILARACAHAKDTRKAQRDKIADVHRLGPSRLHTQPGASATILAC